jgi:hypothetical protein
MPDDKLQPDADALEKWRNMPQNKPSRDALPPMMGGARWLNGLLILMALIALLLWLSQSR